MSFIQRLDEANNELNDAKFNNLISKVKNPKKFSDFNDKTWKSFTLVDKLIVHYYFKKLPEASKYFKEGKPIESLTKFFQETYKMEGVPKFFKQGLSKLMDLMKGKYEEQAVLNLIVPEKFYPFSVNDTELENSNTLVKVSFGKNSITIKKPGYNDIIKKVNIKESPFKLVIESSEFILSQGFKITKDYAEFVPFTVKVFDGIKEVVSKDILDLDDDILIGVPEAKNYEMVVSKKGYQDFSTELTAMKGFVPVKFKLVKTSKINFEQFFSKDNALTSFKDGVGFDRLSEPEVKEANRIFEQLWFSYNTFYKDLLKPKEEKQEKKKKEKKKKDEEEEKPIEIRDSINYVINMLKVTEKDLIYFKNCLENISLVINRTNFSENPNIINDIVNLYLGKWKSNWKNLGVHFKRLKKWRAEEDFEEGWNKYFNNSVRDSAWNAFKEVNIDEEVFNKLWGYYEKVHNKIINSEDLIRLQETIKEVKKEFPNIDDLYLSLEIIFGVEKNLFSFLSLNKPLEGNQLRLIQLWNNSWKKIGEELSKKKEAVVEKEKLKLKKVADFKILVVYKDKAGSAYELFKSKIEEFFNLFGKKVIFVELSDELCGAMKDYELKHANNSFPTLSVGIRVLENKMPNIVRSRIIVFDDFGGYDCDRSYQGYSDSGYKRVAFNTLYRNNWSDEKYVRALVFHELCHGEAGIDDVPEEKFTEYCIHKSKNCYMMQPWEKTGEFKKRTGFCPICKLIISKSLGVLPKIFDEMSKDDKLSLIKQLIIFTPELNKSFNIKPGTLLEDFDEKILKDLIKKDDRYKTRILLIGLESVLFKGEIEQARPYAEKLKELLKGAEEKEEEKYDLNIAPKKWVGVGACGLTSVRMVFNYYIGDAGYKNFFEDFVANYGNFIKKDTGIDLSTLKPDEKEDIILSIILLNMFKFKDNFVGMNVEPTTENGKAAYNLWESGKDKQKAVRNFAVSFHSQTNELFPLLSVLTDKWINAGEEMFRPNNIEDYKKYISKVKNDKNILPLIIRFENPTKQFSGHHFVVFKGVKGNNILINDPETGTEKPVSLPTIQNGEPTFIPIQIYDYEVPVKIKDLFPEAEKKPAVKKEEIEIGSVEASVFSDLIIQLTELKKLFFNMKSDAELVLSGKKEVTDLRTDLNIIHGFWEKNNLNETLGNKGYIKEYFYERIPEKLDYAEKYTKTDSHIKSLIRDIERNGMFAVDTEIGLLIKKAQEIPILEETIKKVDQETQEKVDIIKKAGKKIMKPLKKVKKIMKKPEKD